MNSFNPFRQDITAYEIASFMDQNFPIISFDRDSPLPDLQKLAAKWIDFASRASTHIDAPKSVSVSKAPTLPKKRRQTGAAKPVSTSKVHHEDRGSSSIKRARKEVKVTDVGIKSNKKCASPTRRNNPSRASKSEANSRTTYMYSLTDSQRTRRCSKNEGRQANEAKNKSTRPIRRPTKLKEHRSSINYSSSLTGISDDDQDELPCKASPCPPSPILEFKTHPISTSGSKPCTTWDPEAPLIDLHDDSLDEVGRELLDLCQFSKDVCVDSRSAVTAKSADPHHNCHKEISDLKARIEKLEDLMFEPYRVPPPAVAAILEEFNRL